MFYVKMLSVKSPSEHNNMHITLTLSQIHKQISVEMVTVFLAVCEVRLPGAHANLCAHDQMCLQLGVECGT